MNNNERVKMILNHKHPDKIPFNLEFTNKAHQKMAQFYNDPDFSSKLDNCFTRTNFELPWKEVRTDIFEDAFGVDWNRSVDKDIGTVCNCIVTPENIDEFKMPDPDNPALYAGLEKDIEENNRNFYQGYLGFSLFERAWTLAGMENVLMGMMLDKDFINKLMDKILEYNLRVIENALNYRIDGMMFGDDWGQQTGLLMGPQLWREFIWPRIKQMYDLVKSKGRYVTIHCCGKVDELFPELIDLGVDIFNPFQPEVMDVFEVKRKYGDSLCFYGGISTQKTLPYGTVGQVKDEVKRLIEKVGLNGGYIIAPAHAIPADAKPENVAAMIELLMNQ
jgi:uroporphyrinogen decarboxylase